MATRRRRKNAPKAKQPQGVQRLGDQREERVVSITEVKPNPWNYNRQSKFIFDKEKRSIETFGFIVPPLVRSANEKGDLGHYEIIDGEHRWQACGELGYTKIPVNDLGRVSDRDAEKLTIILNETHGEPEYEKLGALLGRLADDGMDDLLSEIPFPENELRALVALPIDPTGGSGEGSGEGGSGGGGSGSSGPTDEFKTVEIKVADDQMAVIEAAVSAALGQDNLRAPKDVRMALGLERIARAYLGSTDGD